MPWSKLDDEFYDHPKVVAAGTVGAGLFAMALSYSARKLTNGFVPSAMIRRLSADLDDPLALAERLAEIGLFDRTDGGYLVHDYLDYNPPAEKVLAERESARERMRAARDDNGQFGRSSGEVRANISGSSGEVLTAPSPSPSPSPCPIPSPGPVPQNKDNKEELSSFLSESIHAYENIIGLVVSDHQSEEIVDILETLQERDVDPWWNLALDVCADNNKRSWSYMRAVLQNWIRQGHPGLRAREPTAQGPPQKRSITIRDPDTGELKEIEAAQ